MFMCFRLLRFCFFCSFASAHITRLSIFIISINLSAILFACMCLPNILAQSSTCLNVEPIFSKCKPMGALPHRFLAERDLWNFPVKLMATGCSSLQLLSPPQSYFPSLPERLTVSPPTLTSPRRSNSTATVSDASSNRNAAIATRIMHRLHVASNSRYGRDSRKTVHRLIVDHLML